jgi:hypothetical protein
MKNAKPAKKEKLLISLADLKDLILHLKKHKGMKRAEQFVWFTENSSSGENCQYARKAIDSFYLKYYEEISALLRDIMRQMHDIEKRMEEIDNARQQEPIPLNRTG